MINCIGGVQVLFPILELVTLQANDDYEPEDTIDAESPMDPGTPDSLEDWEVLPRTGKSSNLPSSIFFSLFNIMRSKYWTFQRWAIFITVGS